MLAKSTIKQLGQREEEVTRTMSYPPSGSGLPKQKNITTLLKRKKTSRAMLLKFWLSAGIRIRKSKFEEKGQLPTSPALQCLLNMHCSLTKTHSKQNNSFFRLNTFIKQYTRNMYIMALPGIKYTKSLCG